MVTLLSFIFVIGVLVFVHELGHFLAAKSVGMKVEKFYLGFNLFGLGLRKKWGDTEYGIGLFPLGGYVKVAGVIDESMDDSTTGEAWEFQSKNALQQIWFMSAGVIMNVVLAIVLFTIITFKMGIGEPNPQPIIGQILSSNDSPAPAELLGLETGDRILEINGITVNTWGEMTDIVHNQPETMVFVKWQRGLLEYADSVKTISTEMVVDGKIKTLGMIGISPEIIIHEASFSESVSAGFIKTFLWLNLTVESLSMLITGEASFDDVGGPVMIAQIAGESARSGIWTLFNLMAIISINLALLNILPIPGLDGGHIIIASIEGISRRKLPAKIKMGVQQFGMLLLLILFVFIMINDISRLF
ncbi:MAG: RIP metalloprotease RseP [Candidatus Marinimicrobia bacterium]|nr:RIP metalloprotease RseP [Candidatus Neomarinimicrobiota bacterium]MBL7023390.1 RIP metalloprotease RseP [Candidatus Neomarinimicrobiota bacterium]MBL7109729.1 RIP metalloprotease RseP [Candidatus Neomarinimicrobiota bacterium]